jgi:serine protease Do
MQRDLGEVADRLRRITVEVVEGGGRSGGSGVIIGPDRVITNAHVARGARAIVRTWSGASHAAEIAGRDHIRDLALLSTGPLKCDPALLRSDDAKPGEFTVAVGNPMGFVGALSTGVVHAVGPLHGLGPRRWVQAQVRLAPGNSGGPLADVQGRIIGINTMVASGLGLAVPARDISEFLAGRRTPEIGVTVRPVRVTVDRENRPGLLLLEVAAGGLAQRASLIPGDILVGAGRSWFTGPWDLTEALATATGSLGLRFLRGGSTRVRETTVELNGVVLGEAA